LTTTHESVLLSRMKSANCKTRADPIGDRQSVVGFRFGSSGNFPINMPARSGECFAILGCQSKPKHHCEWTGAVLLRASERRHISAIKRKTRGRSDRSNAIRPLAEGETVFQIKENGYAKRESFANVEQGLVKERPLLNETRQGSHKSRVRLLANTLLPHPVQGYFASANPARQKFAVLHRFGCVFCR
jgi:hypothetical protein